MPVLYTIDEDVRLTIDAVDGARVQLLRQFERAIAVVSGEQHPGSFSVDADLIIYDHKTKRLYSVRTADCGAGCRCAVSVVPVRPLDLKDAKLRRRIGRSSMTKAEVSEYLREYRGDRARLRSLRRAEDKQRANRKASR